MRFISLLLPLLVLGTVSAQTHVGNVTLTPSVAKPAVAAKPARVVPAGMLEVKGHITVGTNVRKLPTGSQMRVTIFNSTLGYKPASIQFKVASAYTTYYMYFSPARVKTGMIKAEVIDASGHVLYSSAPAPLKGASLGSVNLVVGSASSTTGSAPVTKTPVTKTPVTKTPVTKTPVTKTPAAPINPTTNISNPTATQGLYEVRGNVVGPDGKGMSLPAGSKVYVMIYDFNTPAIRPIKLEVRKGSSGLSAGYQVFFNPSRLENKQSVIRAEVVDSSGKAIYRSSPYLLVKSAKSQADLVVKVTR